MQFTFDYIEGDVLKSIENINAFHMQGAHLKRLVIQLGKQPILLIKDRTFNGNVPKIKKFQLHTITKVQTFQGDELERHNDERHENRKERSRSKSKLGKLKDLIT